jgi:hypothetical protein
MKHLLKPSFFIVGAAKAGTTAVADYLGQHPQIYMCPVKEPHYFAKDIRLEDLRPLLKKRLRNLDLNAVIKSEGKTKLHRAFITDTDVYHQLFSFADKELIAGEASPSYLYSEVAAREIHNYNPKAKIIILLREPVSRAFSHYQMDLRLAYTKGSFEEALTEDAAASTDSWGSRSHYRELGNYSAQVKRYLDVFPENQILILLYDELRADTAATVQKILRFLEVDATTEALDLSAKNETVVSRFNLGLQSSLAEKIKTKFKPMLGESALKQKLKKFFYKKPEQSHPAPATEKMLKEYFSKDLQELERLTGINLKAWK